MIMLVRSFLELGGRRWQLTKLPAWFAKENPPPLMASVSAWHGGAWVALDSDELVDLLVPDWETLTGLERAAFEFNYGFLKTWRPIRLPASMQNSAGAVSHRYVDPLFASLIGAQLATLDQLRTVYSLEDAFLLLEVLTVKSINEHKAMQRK